MSPTEYPAGAAIKEASEIGNLFTLFLHCPIKAFVSLSGVEEMSQQTWDKALASLNAIEGFIAELISKEDANIGKLLHSAQPSFYGFKLIPVLRSFTDKSYKRFAQDDFLRQFIIRFILMSAVLQCHSAFESPKQMPSAYPALQESLTTAPELVTKIKELVTLTGAKGFKEV